MSLSTLVKWIFLVDRESLRSAGIISRQPYVRSADVRIDRRMHLENAFGYGELEGRMILAEVGIDYRGEAVRARLEYDPDKDYPMMKLI